VPDEESDEPKRIAHDDMILIVMIGGIILFIPLILFT
jgi:hypothetical protein